jgi:hypothetical protein
VTRLFAALLIASCGSGPSVKSLFLSPRTPGAFGGISQADATCQSEATGADLSGVWRALIGNSKAEATRRLVGPGPFVAVKTLTVIFNDRNEIDNGGPAATLNVDAHGLVQNPGNFWSGVSSNCNQWSSSASSDLGTAGSLSTVGVSWIDIGTFPCNSLQYLVCAEQ